MLLKQVDDIEFFSGSDGSVAVKELVVMKAMEFSREKLVCAERVTDMNTQVIK